MKIYGIFDGIRTAERPIDEKRLWIGSASDADFILNGAGIAPKHACLYRKGDELILENGQGGAETTINGQKIDVFICREYPCQIRMGEQNFEISLQSGESGSDPVYLLKKMESVADDNSATRMFVPDDVTAATIIADTRIREIAQEIQKTEVYVANEDEAMRHSRFHLKPGSDLGKFTIIKCIGKGGMGEVFLAKHKTLDALRAIKVLSREITDGNSLFLDRFLREARIASEIRHPNVVSVMDVETDLKMGISYIVMEYVDGGSLRHILKTLPNLPEAQACAIVLSVAQALREAEAHKIVHRDIKPDNIMLTMRGEVKLADLGIAKTDEDESNLTKTNVMIGTPAYLSPEQVRNAKSVDIRADIYSLGATFYEMLTGCHPYAGTNTYEILHQLFSAPVPDPRKIVPAISAPIAKLVMRMMAKDPKDRFQTVDELLREMDNCFPRFTSVEGADLIREAVAGVSNDNGAQLLATHSTFKVSGPFKRYMPWYLSGAALFVLLAVSLLWGILLRSEKKTNFIPPPSVPVLVSTDTFALTLATQPGAEVTLVDEKRMRRNYQADGKGALKIDDLTAGEYEILVECRKFRRLTKKITIPETLKLNLPLAADVHTLCIKTLPGTRAVISGQSYPAHEYLVPETGTLSMPGLFDGIYTIQLSKEGWQNAERVLQLTKDQTLEIALSENLVLLRLETEAEAEVFLEQQGQIKYYRKADRNGIALVDRICVGTYLIRIVKRDCLPEERTLDIRENMRLTLPLTTQTYDLRIRTEANAELVFYRKKTVIGTYLVPASGLLIRSKLPRGEYRIQFRKEGFHEHSESVEINGNREITVTLRPKIVKPADPAAARIPRDGTLLVVITGSSAAISHLLKNKSEYQVDNGPWRPLRTQTFLLPMKPGEHTISIAMTGMQPVLSKKMQIPAGTRVELFFPAIPNPSTITVNCREPNAEFLLNSKWYKCGTIVTVDPYIPYEVKIRARKYKTLIKTVTVNEPDKAFAIQVKLEHAQEMASKNQDYLAGEAAFARKEYKKALEFYLRAVNDGDVAAAWRVGRIYEDGVYALADEDRAVEMYRRCAAAKHPGGSFQIAERIRLGKLRGTTEEMLQLYQVAMREDNPKAFILFAEWHTTGTDFLRKDLKKAIEYYTRAAETGDEESMYKFGLFYENRMQYNLALNWYKKAVQSNGYPPARKKLEIFKNLTMP